MGVYKVISRILVFGYVGVNVRLNKVWTCWLFNPIWLKMACYKSSFRIQSFFPLNCIIAETLFIKKSHLHIVIFVDLLGCGKRKSYERTELWTVIAL